MSSNVFHRLHRIRKVHENVARQQAAACAQTLEVRQAEVVQLQERMDRSRELAEVDPTLLAHHHAWALQAEMGRRRAHAAVDVAEAQLQEAKGELERKAVEARTVELIAEAVDQRVAHEVRMTEQRALDEVGTQRWLRRAS